MAKVLEQNEVIIVGCEDPGLMRSAKFSTAPTMEEAFAMASRTLGSDVAAQAEEKTARQIESDLQQISAQTEQDKQQGRQNAM